MTTGLTRTKVINKETLLQLTKYRQAGVPLITASNHMSTVDDPLIWGIPGLPINDPDKCRWTLAAQEICFPNALLSTIFRNGKCIPIVRGAGIDQEGMEQALAQLEQGKWVHTFPEGCVVDKLTPIPRLKWGIGSLVARCSTTPLVLPVAHSGFQRVLPEKSPYGGRGWIPRMFQSCTILVGEPLHFDVPSLKRQAMAVAAAPRDHLEDADPFVASATRWLVSGNATKGGPSSIDLHDGPGDPDSLLERWVIKYITDRVEAVLRQLSTAAHLANGEPASAVMEKDVSGPTVRIECSSRDSVNHDRDNSSSATHSSAT
eukprot:jgi/Mesvir1/22250/Mv14384-RA.1